MRMAREVEDRWFFRVFFVSTSEQFQNDEIGFRDFQ